MNILNFKADIHNPFCNDTFINWFNISGETPIDDLNWEIQMYFYKPSLFSFNFKVSTKEDHAGTFFEIGLLGVTLSIYVYDCRHY